MRSFLSSLTVVLLTLLICALLLRHRLTRMRLARRELQRREEARKRTFEDGLHRLTGALDGVRVTLTCDARPAIEGLAKAFAACSNAARVVERSLAIANKKRA